MSTFWEWARGYPSLNLPLKIYSRDFTLTLQKEVKNKNPYNRLPDLVSSFGDWLRGRNKTFVRGLDEVVGIRI